MIKVAKLTRTITSGNKSYGAGTEWLITDEYERKIEFKEDPIGEHWSQYDKYYTLDDDSTVDENGNVIHISFEAASRDVAVIYIEDDASMQRIDNYQQQMDYICRDMIVTDGNYVRAAFDILGIDIRNRLHVSKIINA